MEILTAKVNKIEMDYFTFGTGERTFVIIPGLSLKSVTLSAKPVAAAYKQFCEDFTTYVFDRRKNVSGGYSIREMARDTAEVMKSLGIENADIFGTSQGGMIAQCMAIDYPELVHSIVLGSTAPRANDRMVQTINGWIGFAEKHDVKGLNHSVFQTIYSGDFLEKYKKALPVIEQDGTDEECDRFLIFAKACTNFDVFNELPKIKCPALVLGAEEDKVLTGAASHEIAEKLDCEIFMYGDEYNHAVYDEAPDYKERIMRFLKSI